MMSFCDLSAAGKTALTAAFYLAFCVGICLVFVRRHKQSVWINSLLVVDTLAALAVMLLYATALRSVRLAQPAAPLAEAFCRWPVWLSCVLLVVLMICYAYIIYEEFLYRRTVLTRSSIKEGVDKISSGLCFYYESGRVVLMNYRMDQLCHLIAGCDLQNAERFYRILQNGEVDAAVQRLSYGEQPSFRLPDGSVWMFTHQQLEGIHQLIAADITQLQEITDELAEKNRHLEALNRRLRQYGENVDELTRTKERLEIKARIHRELSQTLLATRRYLLDENNAYEAPLEQWQKNIAMLRKEAEVLQDEDPMSMLRRAVKMTGVDLSIEGELPEPLWLQRFFVQAAAEALTNAISHAGAKTLFMRLTHDEKTCSIQIRNDGVQPQSAIVEGGGLGSLRRKVEDEGGVMTVTHIPEFTLTVILPKERGDIL